MAACEGGHCFSLLRITLDMRFGLSPKALTQIENPALFDKIEQGSGVFQFRMSRNERKNLHDYFLEVFSSLRRFL